VAYTFHGPKWAQRQIDRLEVPDCGCPNVGIRTCQLAHGCSRGCRVLQKNGDCGHAQLPGEPCPHTIAADHDVPFDDWSRMILDSPEPDHDSHQKSKPASDSTNALPGSPARVDVMQGRADRGECLSSPEDLDPEQLGRVVRQLLKGSSEATPRHVLAIETREGVQPCAT
jgi:hypothetical protein